MSTAVRTLPPHGTYARANGSPGYRPPCGCEPCIQNRRRTRKAMRVNRELGQGAQLDGAKVRHHLGLLRQTMTWGQISAAADCETGTLHNLFYNPEATVRRTTQARILAVEPQPVTSPGMYLDATGYMRRLQALRALGYSTAALADAAGSAKARIELISTGKQSTVRYQLAAKILKTYAALSQTPAPPSCSATVARKHAMSKGWALPAAWDDDSIDDPAATPDWTGACGTDRGWWMHTLQKLRMCERCRTAHEKWKADHKGLPRDDYMAALGASRASASSRGVDIAHDGRELMRVSGLDYDQAAARIGVTRQHLQQELQRHPAPVDEAAAA